MLLPLIAIVLLLGTTRAAYAGAEGYLIGKDGAKYPGKVVWDGDEKYFVSCPSGTRFSLTKYPMPVVGAPDGACPRRMHLDSTESDVPADSPEERKAAAEAEKARKAARNKIRKILEDYGYDVDESDID
jgi:hypothetical protein